MQIWINGIFVVVVASSPFCLFYFFLSVKRKATQYAINTRRQMLMLYKKLISELKISFHFKFQ